MFCLKGASFARPYRRKLLSDKNVAGAGGELHPFDFDPQPDHMAWPLDLIVTPEVIKQQEIGVGNEVFLVGLFSQHHGERRNIPIVRVGNIAAMPEEKVFTTKSGAIDAYLIEARSIGGISGSPVFVVSSPIRASGDTAMFRLPAVYLPGLVHGHWDASSSELDEAIEDSTSRTQVNMGIAIVVPCDKIVETLDQENIRAARYR